jgi:hypothetical protein
MAQRSQVIVFQNLTASTLNLQDSDCGGQWTHSSHTVNPGSTHDFLQAATWTGHPPDTIAPGAIVAWGSESKDLPWTPATLFGAGAGTGGHAHYFLPAQNGVQGDQDDVWIEWDVPYLGANGITYVVMLNLTEPAPGGISKTHLIERVGHDSVEDTWFLHSQGAAPGPVFVFPVGEKHPTDALRLTAIGSASDALTVDFKVPQTVSWVSNHPGPDIAQVYLYHAVAMPIDVALVSDDPATIDVPPHVSITSYGTVSLNVPQKSGTFTSKTVHLTASYAGQQIKVPVQVVRPENLPLPPLIINASGDDDPCSKHFFAKTSQSFYVTNPNVIYDSTILTYKWIVTGAAAPQTDQPTLTIPSLPPAGTHVTIVLEIKNTSRIHAKGTFDFTTTSEQYTLDEMIREANCRVSRYNEINKYIPPWLPVELGERVKTGDPAAINRLLASLEIRTKLQLEAGKSFIESIEKIRTAIQER